MIAKGFSAVFSTHLDVNQSTGCVLLSSFKSFLNFSFIFSDTLSFQMSEIQAMNMSLVTGLYAMDVKLKPVDAQSYKSIPSYTGYRQCHMNS